MNFNGQVLERGFWLYVWKIEFRTSEYYYVGRTGDSSSAHASSPFNRIGQHLDFREKAKGNSLAKRLKQAGIEPRKSEFNMVALGPFFDEQPDFESHKPKRDYMATLELEVANFLKEECGKMVLGVHHKGIKVQDNTLIEVKTLVRQFVKTCS